MKYFIAGHNGMVGRAVMQKFQNEGKLDLLTASRQDLDLTSQKEVLEFLRENKPDEIIICAAKVGGIQFNNDYPADFIYDNLMIQTNLINGAHLSGINKLLFLGSSCIYPKICDQPIREDKLLSGYLEPSNEAYAIAKIAGIKMCESYNKQFKRDYRSLMPTNLYGPGDNFDLETSHVVPALMRKIHEAKVRQQKKVEIWGSGKPKREFLHVNDMASACFFVSNLDKKVYSDSTLDNFSHLNVGTGFDISIEHLAKLMSNIIGYEGKLNFDNKRLDGTPRKLLNVDKLRSLGWNYEIDLEEGLESTYLWFLESIDKIKPDA